MKKILIFLFVVLSIPAKSQVQRYMFQITPDTKFPILLSNKGYDTLSVISIDQLRIYDHLLDVNRMYRGKIEELQETMLALNINEQKNSILTGSISDLSKSNLILAENNTQVISQARDLHTMTLGYSGDIQNSVSNIEKYVTEVGNKRVKKLRFLCAALGGGLGYFAGKETGNEGVGVVVGAVGAYSLTYLF